MIFEDVKNIINKFRIAKLDIPAIVNSSILLILAWIASFWAFEFITIIGAFSLGVDMVVYNSFIDFDTVNTSASQVDLWSSAENINTIFFTPVVFMIVAILVTMLLLIRWNSDRLNMRRFEFWLIACIALRLSANYIFGHLYNLWNWNLVTDFMYITTNGALKWICIIFSLAVTWFVFTMLSSHIRKLFNPFCSNRVNNLFSNIFFPILICCVFMFIWYLPHIQKLELSALAYFFVFGAFAMCRPFVRRYRGISDQIEYIDKEKINIVPIIILVFCCIVDIYLMSGRYLKSSPYRYAFLENAIMVTIFAFVLLLLLIAYCIYVKRKNKYKQEINTIQKQEEEEISLSKQVFGQKENDSCINMSKYKQYDDQDNQDKTDEIQIAEDKGKYGFKQYDLDKYNKGEWQ